MPTPPPPPPLPLRILTHNIRYATPTPAPPEPPWPTRLPLLLSSLRFHTTHIPPTILCLQEALYPQLLSILSGLNQPAHPPSSNPSSPEWAFLGVGRDDGLHAGEFSPILYRPHVFTLLRSRTLWLSNTPHIPGSKSWDAALPRILTIGDFEHRASGRRLVVMNTHLDDRGKRSRVEAAGMIVREVAAVGARKGGKGTPVVVAGDFNSEVGGGAYRVMTEGEGLGDVREGVEGGWRYGFEDTFTGFGEEGGEGAMRIDFLFVSRGGRGMGDAGEGEGKGGEVEGGGEGKGKGPWRVDGYGVLENRLEDGVFISDHRAVVGDVTLL